MRHSGSLDLTIRLAMGPEYIRDFKGGRHRHAPPMAMAPYCLPAADPRDFSSVQCPRGQREGISGCCWLSDDPKGAGCRQGPRCLAEDAWQSCGAAYAPRLVSSHRCLQAPGETLCPQCWCLRQRFYPFRKTKSSWDDTPASTSAADQGPFPLKGYTGPSVPFPEPPESASMCSGLRETASFNRRPPA